MSLKLFKAHKKAKAMGADSLKYSSHKGKIFVVDYEGKKIHFGSSKELDFLDTGNYDAREAKREHLRKLKNWEGEPLYTNKNNAVFWEYNILW